MDIRKIFIILLVLGGLVISLYKQENIGIALMGLGIWLMQLLHEVK